MRQGGLILAVGRVRAKKQRTKTKSRHTQDAPRNPQQPGDRDNLEMACNQKTEKKTPNPGQFVYCGAYKKRNKKVENAKYFPSVFDAGGCSYQVITFSPVKCPLQRCNRDR